MSSALQQQILNGKQKMESKQLDSAHYTIIRNDIMDEDPAVVYLESDLIETSTVKQIEAMIGNPSVSRVRVMPDCHVGNGCCVGFTSRVDMGKVVPAFVGGDIGCGILTYRLDRVRINLDKAEKNIRNLIPMGNGHEHVHEVIPVEESYVSRYLADCQKNVQHFIEQWNVDISVPSLDFAYLEHLCGRIGIDFDYCMRSFGTLGGGNHFIEIDVDSSTQEHYLTIHSGSRAFGMKLFEYHNKKIQQGAKCLEGQNAVEYCCDMILAQQLAVMNRHIMLDLICRELTGDSFDRNRLIESIHNYIDFRKMILRKGAIAAEEGQLCIVALNMRDGILVCRGKGNEEWNESCAHGCGRIMSRSEARRRIKLKDYKAVMADVVTTCVCKETLDEAPQAYKDMDLIVSALQPTVSIEMHLECAMNLKGI